MKKNNATKTKREKEETLTINQMMVLFESLRGDIQLLAENFLSFRDSITAELRDFKQEMYTFREEMYSFRRQTGENFKLVFEYFSRIEDEMLEVKAELNKMDEKKADKKKLEELTKRVERLEREFEECKRLARVRKQKARQSLGA